METTSFSLGFEDKIAVLTLSQAPLNSLNHRFFSEFHAFADSVLPEADWRGLLIIGQGKHFSAGADLPELSRLTRGRSQRPEFLLANSQSFSRLEQAPFPVVAAISGCCLGAGLELALACQYRVAAANAILGFPETGFGLIPGCGGCVRSTAALSLGQSIDLVLSGRNLLAPEALELGLVHAVVERNQLREAGLRLIRSLN